MRGDGSLFLQSAVATSLVNADSSRCSRPSLDVRKEGWTETWGGLGADGGKVGRSSPSSPPTPGSVSTAWSERWSSLSPPAHWNDHELPYAKKHTLEAAASPLLSSSGEGVALTLTQHRPAWAEQLVLRVAGTPHVVLNSAYSTAESTGPMPMLMDIGAGGSERDGEGAPGLVGRHNPGGMRSASSTGAEREKAVNEQAGGVDGTSLSSFSPSSSSRSVVGCRSDIVEYLRLSRGIDLDTSLSADLRSECLAYAALVADELDVILRSLRYGDDDAWEQVYKPQSVEACLRPDDGIDGGMGEGERQYKKRRRWGLFRFMASFQAWTERTVALRDLLLSNSRMRDELFRGKDVRVDRAVEAARVRYRALDTKLARSGGATLLGTDRPTTVDAALFGHLAEALCDVHLVVALAEYAHLVRFFRDTYERYFGREYTGAGAAVRADWIRWNDRANAANAFDRIPMGDKALGAGGGLGWGGGGGGGEYRDAIAIMQSVALHRRDLGEALSDAALQRRTEDGVRAAGEAVDGSAGGIRVAGEMFRRWRMGGTLGPDDEDGNVKKAKAPGRDAGGSADGSRGGDGGGGAEGGEEEDEMTRKNREHMERMVREAKTNDELWMSGVILGSMLVFAFAAAGANVEG